MANLEGVTGAYIRRASDDRIVAVLFQSDAWTGQGTLAEGGLTPGDLQPTVPSLEVLLEMLEIGQAFAVVETQMYPNGEIATARLPIELSILSPSKDMSELPLVPTSGFPLTIEMVANGEIGIAGPGSGMQFPQEGATGRIVFDDPDYFRDPSDPYYGCLSWEPRYGPYKFCCEEANSANCDAYSQDCIGNSDCNSSWVCVERYTRLNVNYFFTGPPCEANETYLEFTPDVDLAGVVDLAGNAPIREDPANGLCSENPLLHVFAKSRYGPYQQSGANDLPVEIGPDLGTSDGLPVLDGYGPGANDDLPGLVLLADAGFGLILDDESKDAVGARNLSGFLNTVSYVLVDGSDRVRVEANLMSPRLLFRPTVLLDQMVSDPSLGDEAPENIPRQGEGGNPITSLIRVDGGPVTEVGFNGYGIALPEEVLVITVRAFVVNGRAPAVMEDRNDDGVIDASDLPPEYELISNEAVAHFKHYYDGLEDVFCYFFYDLDGNGFASYGEVTPGGAGRITPVPR